MYRPFPTNVSKQYSLGKSHKPLGEMCMSGWQKTQNKKHDYSSPKPFKTIGNRRKRAFLDMGKNHRSGKHECSSQEILQNPLETLGNPYFYPLAEQYRSGNTKPITVIANHWNSLGNNWFGVIGEMHTSNVSDENCWKPIVKASVSVGLAESTDQWIYCKRFSKADRRPCCMCVCITYTHHTPVN